MYLCYTLEINSNVVLFLTGLHNISLICSVAFKFVLFNCSFICVVQLNSNDSLFLPLFICVKGLILICYSNLSRKFTFILSYYSSFYKVDLDTHP